MKISTALTYALITYLLTLATPSASQAPTPASSLSFNSNDPELQATFDWAKNMALTDSHGTGDPDTPSLSNPGKKRPQKNVNQTPYVTKTSKTDSHIRVWNRNQRTEYNLLPARQ